MKISDCISKKGHTLYYKCPYCGKWVDEVIVEKYGTFGQVENAYGYVEDFECEDVSILAYRCPHCHEDLGDNPFEEEDRYEWRCRKRKISDAH